MAGLVPAIFVYAPGFRFPHDYWLVPTIANTPGADRRGLQAVFAYRRLSRYP